ncbi:hypothetical protein [Azospirillum doebereinerae]
MIARSISMSVGSGSAVADMAGVYPIGGSRRRSDHRPGADPRWAWPPGLTLPSPGATGVAGRASPCPRAKGLRDAPEHKADVASDTVVEVIDPRHPLFGRYFPVAGITAGWRAEAQVSVTYRPGVVLRIPITATSLRADPGPQPAATKLCVEGLRELAILAGPSEEACRSSPPPSGTACQRTSAPGSPTSSPRRCRG